MSPLQEYYSQNGGRDSGGEIFTGRNTSDVMEMLQRSKSRRHRTSIDKKQTPPPQQATPSQNPQQPPVANQPAPVENQSVNKETRSNRIDRYISEKLKDPKYKFINDAIAHIDERSNNPKSKEQIRQAEIWKKMSPEAKRRMVFYQRKLLPKSYEEMEEDDKDYPLWKELIGYDNPHAPFAPVKEQLDSIFEGISNLKDAISGTPEEFGKVKTGTPEQEEYQKNLYKTEGGRNDPLYQAGYKSLQEALSNDPESIRAFEAPYLEKFEQETVPGLLEKFGSLGTGAGATYGSGLQNSLAQAGRGLQKDLAAMREGQKETARGQAGAYSNIPVENQLTGLKFSPYESHYKPAQAGYGDYAAKAALEYGIPALFGAL
jgi:hypothetical protein